MTSGSIWVIGELGQIGGALVRQLGSRAVAPSIAELDLRFPERVQPCFDGLLATRGTPAAIINAAAYTLVDKAEEEEPLAMTLNATAPGEMAAWCARHDVPFVHYSTDYVYPGTGTRPWREDDATGPLNAYGRTKLEGDTLVMAHGGRHLILRTCWVYDATGRNFFTTILRLAREREELRIVGDQIGAPSYAPHLADHSLRILEKALSIDPFPAGLYHFCHGGETSWHGFASAICEGARARGLDSKARAILPIASAEYPTPARRPQNSRLDQTKLKITFQMTLPTWQDGLNACLSQWQASA